MIDIASETLIPLRLVPDHIPSARRGHQLSMSTVYRMVGDGLEVVKIRGTQYTSLEAIQRFSEASSPGVLATASAAVPRIPVTPATPRQKKQTEHAAQVHEELMNMLGGLDE